MKSKTLRIALATTLLACSAASLAQPPTITNVWDAPSVNVGYHNSAAGCVYSFIGATNSWNAVGANFYFLSETIPSHPRVAQQALDFNLKNVTVEDAPDVTIGAIMEARTSFDPISPGKIVNSDIFIDRNRLNQTPGVAQIACTTVSAIPADVADGESAAIHELGHSLGFGSHTSHPQCAMFATLAAGQVKRTLCIEEKQEFLAKYGEAFKIQRLDNVVGPQGINIPARIFYGGSPTFPVGRTTRNIGCPSGWSCSDYNGAYSSQAPSPLPLNFRCTNPYPRPTATFRWLTTLTDAIGAVTNAVEHTSTCTGPAGSVEGASAAEEDEDQNKVIITQ